MKKARAREEMREKTEAAIKFAEALFTAGEREAIRPVLRKIIKTGTPLYRMGVETARELKLLSASENEIVVETACEVCAHLYPVKVPAWKTSARDQIALCPKCSAFQMIDLSKLRKEWPGHSERFAN